MEHRGPPSREHDTVCRLIEGRRAQRLPPGQYRTCGIHHTDPRAVAPEHHRADFCVAVDAPVAPNLFGVVGKLMPGGRCAVARHVGSRDHVVAADFLHRLWLPASGEQLRDFPVFFHYVNVGPGVTEATMITDVYLPLR